MVTFNQKTLGKFLVAFAIVLSVILIFIKINTDQRNTLLCDAVSYDPNLDMASCPVHNDPTSWYLFAAFGLAFFVFTIGIYLFFSSQRMVQSAHLQQLQPKETASFTQVDLSKFADEEKKIYLLLKSNNGSMFQSSLIKETGFSKVKITRILDKMENRQVLERKRRGMANLIILK